MPPQSSADYDLQLQTAMRDLSSLEGDMGTDAAMLYCHKDVPAEGNTSFISPHKIAADLHAKGLRWWVDWGKPSQKGSVLQYD